MGTDIIIGFPKRPKGVGHIHKYVHDGLIRLWKDSVREFIKEAIKYIHVDTGMSMASLLPLGTQVRLRTLIESKIGSGKIKPGHRTAYGQFANNNDGPKSKAFGEELGQDAHTLTFGTPANPVLVFEFKIVVLQHYLNDYGYNNTGNHWQSIDRAQNAFLAYFHNNLTNPKYLSTKALVNLLLIGK